MKMVIYCKKATGIHSFYLITENKEFYLFSQNYRKGVEKYYGKGVVLDDAIKYSKSHNDSAIIRTMNKLPMYIRYLEKKYGISVLNKSKKNKQELRLRYA